MNIVLNLKTIIFKNLKYICIYFFVRFGLLFILYKNSFKLILK